MNAFLGEVAVLLGGRPPLSQTDRQIIETMIEIGAGPAEIVETFGYAAEQVVEVVELREATPADPSTMPALPDITLLRIDPAWR
jgi:hypothetical protein